MTTSSDLWFSGVSVTVANIVPFLQISNTKFPAVGAVDAETYAESISIVVAGYHLNVPTSGYTCPNIVYVLVRGAGIPE